MIQLVGGSLLLLVAGIIFIVSRFKTICKDGIDMDPLMTAAVLFGTALSGCSLVVYHFIY